MRHVAEFFFPTEANLGSGSWSSRKARAVGAGMALAILFAMFFILDSEGDPLWLFLACLGYGGWALNAGWSWIHAFERAMEEARREKLRAWDPPHEDDQDKSDPS